MTKFIFIATLSTLILTGCSVSIDSTDDSKVIVDKQELKDLTYQWAMYREIAIIQYARRHKVSREDAEAHLKKHIDDAKETQKRFYEFVAQIEYENKWEKRDDNSKGK